MKKSVVNRIKRACFGLMSVIMLSSGMRVYADGEHDGRLTDRTDHTDKKFEDWEYERMNADDFHAITQDIDTLVADAANADAVLDLIVGMEDYANELGRNYAIAHINSDLVADDKYWDDEVQFNSDLATDIFDEIQINYRKIAESPNAQVLKDRVTDEEWEEILEYEEMTQEQKDLSSKETELSLKYDVLSLKEYKTTIGGKQYTSEELQKEYTAGNIEMSDYMAGDAEILKAKNEEWGALYLELVGVRDKLAKSYGYDNYADYAYDKIYDRDYKPEDLAEYREGVKEYLVPFKDVLTSILYGEHYEELSDLYQEKRTVDECLETLREYLPKVSSDLLVSLDFMEQHNAYDLSVDPKKAPGGYTTSVQGYNAPFMYNCASGDISDMETLIHEFGHYNQMYYMSEDSWYYGETNIDLAEIHSQGLELLFMDFAEDIYGDNAEVMKLNTVFQLVYAAIEGVKEDAFQYEVYTHADGLTLDDVNKYYYEASTEYGGDYAYMYSNSLYYSKSGYIDKDVNYDWIQVHHTFQSPMYYISYSTSVSAVFELLDVIMDDRDEGIDTYLALVDAEFQDDFQETLEKVGLNNPIKEPRFDLYADDLGFLVGAEDERTVYKDYPEHEPTTYWGEARPGKEKEEVEEEDDGEDGDEDAKEADDGEKASTDEKERGRDRSSDDEEEGGGAAASVTILIVLAVVLLVLIVATVILLSISAKKRKKEEEARRNMSPAPGMPPQQPQYQVPQYQAPSYQQPVQNAAPVVPAYQPAQPVQPVQNAAPVVPAYQPAQPVQPVQNAAPVVPAYQPAQPVQPVQSAAPEVPAYQPAQPVQPVQSAAPEIPAYEVPQYQAPSYQQPVQPVQPAAPAAAETAQPQIPPYTPQAPAQDMPSWYKPPGENN